jgi:hypothetical protein
MRGTLHATGPGIVLYFQVALRCSCQAPHLWSSRAAQRDAIRGVRDSNLLWSNRDKGVIELRTRP